MSTATAPAPIVKIAKVAKTKAPASNKASPGRVQLYSAEDYMTQLGTLSTTIVKPDWLKKLAPPDYQRGAVMPQVKKIKAALLAGEFVPDIILSERIDAAGKKSYAIVDGLQRSTAAREIGYSLRATIIRFGSESRERLHFVGFQNTRAVNKSLLCDVNNSDPVNAEMKRISLLDGHPIFGKVYWGRGSQADDTIQSQQLASTVIKKCVTLEELEAFTRVVATIWPVRRSNNKAQQCGTVGTSLPWRSGGLRGLSEFYRDILDTDFDVRNPEHVTHMQSFDWVTTTVVGTLPAVAGTATVPATPVREVEKSIADLSTSNSKTSGQLIGKALITHWRAYKAV